MNNDDASIIKRVLAGDIESFGLLIDRYQNDVVMIVSAMLFSRQESDDIIQNVFIEAFDKLDRFDTNREFSKWIKGITRNLVKMHLRKLAKQEKFIVNKSLIRLG